MFDRDAVLAAVDISALADELLGPRGGTQASPSWPCPVSTHAQTGRTPPVSLYLGRRGDQRWACHGCGAGGTAIDMVMAAHGVDVRRALELLAIRSEGPRRLLPAAILRPAPNTPDPDALRALDEYVGACARRLWRPAGRSVLTWLIECRGVPPEVLEHNLVGADPGPGVQDRPAGVPRRSGAVLPVLQDGRAVYAQLRRLHPGPGQPRYLSVARQLAPNPGLARYRPHLDRGGPLVVTEGPIDALAAAAGGYAAAAVLGVGGLGPKVARMLADERRGVVVALDADEAGRAGAERLVALMQEVGAPRPVVLAVPREAGDLAGWMVRASDWQRTLRAAVALASCERSPGAAIAIS